jgi:translation initiation factor eIF-2B subunit gamma
VKLPKPLLWREPNFTIHSTYLDAHFYIFSHWVLELLEDANIFSIKADLIPLLIKLQFKREEGFPSESCISLAGGPLNESMDKSANEAARRAVKDPIRVYAHVLKDGVCDRVNRLEVYKKLNLRMINLKASPSAPWKRAPLSTNKQTTSTITGREFTIGENSSVTGSVIGQHCKIGANTIITNCVIYDNVTIGANCEIGKKIIHHFN